MDWQSEIHKFKHLNSEDIGLFAPPREMEQAVATYNKAVDLLALNSDDIAVIALKRLAASYPMFAHAAFLLGCCQMQAGLVSDALEHFEHVSLLDLPEEEHARAINCLQVAKKTLDSQAQIRLQEQGITAKSTLRKNSKTKDNRKSKQADKTKKTSNNEDLAEIIPDKSMETPVIQGIKQTGANILQPTGKRHRVRMASEKERQEVIRKSEFPEEEETHVVYKKEPIEYIRVIVPIVIIVIVAGLLVWGGISLGSHFLNRRGEDTPDESARLQWLEKRLDELAGENSLVSDLLDEYDRFKAPVQEADPISETSETDIKETTTIVTTTTEMPTTETTEDSAEKLAQEALLSLYSEYEYAFENQNSDQVAVSELLLEMQERLEEIPDNILIETFAVSDDNTNETEKVTISAQQLKADVKSLLESIADAAAEQLRLSGRSYFDQGNYELAIVDYEKAFSISPFYYNGGIAYSCGRTHQELNQFEQAKPYYEFVVANFPGSELAGYSQNRLVMMGFGN